MQGILLAKTAPTSSLSGGSSKAQVQQASQYKHKRNKVGKK
jgi:hypothetical protein